MSDTARLLPRATIGNVHRYTGLDSSSVFTAFLGSFPGLFDEHLESLGPEMMRDFSDSLGKHIFGEGIYKIEGAVGDVMAVFLAENFMKTSVIDIISGSRAHSQLNN